MDDFDDITCEEFYAEDDAYDLWRDQQDADAGFTGLDNEVLVDN